MWSNVKTKQTLAIQSAMFQYVFIVYYVCLCSICPSFSPNEWMFVWMCCVCKKYENFLSTVPIVCGQLPFSLNKKRWITHKQGKEAVCQCNVVAFRWQLHTVCAHIERIHFAIRPHWNQIPCPRKKKTQMNAASHGLSRNQPNNIIWIHVNCFSRLFVSEWEFHSIRIIHFVRIHCPLSNKLFVLRWISKVYIFHQIFIGCSELLMEWAQLKPSENIRKSPWKQQTSQMSDVTMVWWLHYSNSATWCW